MNHPQPLDSQSTKFVSTEIRLFVYIGATDEGKYNIVLRPGVSLSLGKI